MDREADLSGTSRGRRGKERGRPTLAEVEVSRARKLSLVTLASSAGDHLGRGDDLKKKDMDADVASPQSKSKENGMRTVE